MNNHIRKFLIRAFFLVLTFGGVTCSIQAAGQFRSAKTSEVDSVRAIIIRVNDHWQSAHSAKVSAFWDHAAYQTGNMAAYEVTGKSTYIQYATDWAIFNQWQGATSNDKANWKYNYGETMDHVLFGDWQVCFQTYIDLYNLDKQQDPQKIARAKEVIEYEMSTSKNDYWWWSDGLYMVMPVMTKLYKVTHDRRYLDKLFEYFSYADSVMFDAEVGLYYRDARYVYPKHKTPDAKKDFWSRGDGWVFAAIAKVLADLPKNAPHRALYLSRFKSMAKAVAAAQHPEGYWCRSILDGKFAPGPETSGTAFFVYGMQKGINDGILSGTTYQMVANKGWAYLKNIALQPDGTVGYVQPIGDRAIPGQIVDKQSTADFGVGAFLLAAAARYKHLKSF
jgi:rhamnogalacturonyl hydrolase YesR